MIKYCALTTMSSSMKSFMLPALQKMKENGYEVSIACADDEAFRAQIEPDFQFFPLDISRGFDLKKTIKNIFYLKKLFKQKQFQILEYGTENVSFCAAIAGRLAKVPIRIYDHWGARYVGLNGFQRKLSIFIEKTAAACSTDVRQVSHRNAEMCIRQGIYPEKKVKVLGKGGTIGVDFNRFDRSKRGVFNSEIRERHSIANDMFIFGFVGRIQRDKGINELIRAFRRLSESIQNIVLLLVGPIDSENPIEEELMRWAKGDKNVIFAGFSTETEKYMSSFDILVHPTYREGFGMVLQEAAAVGTPIITTDIIGPGEFIQNNVTGILVPSKDEDALKEAMENMYNNADIREKHADNCYKFTRDNFERSVMIKRIIADRNELAKSL